MSLKALTSMNFALVKAAIKQVLIAARDNQLALYEAAGKTEIQLENDYGFEVKQDLFCSPDVSECPLVNIYNKQGLFEGQGHDYPDGQWQTYHLAVDCYAASTAEEDSDLHSDQLAAKRLDYLWSQVYKILMSEENYHKGLASIVRSTRFVHWKQKIVSNDPDTAETILAIQSVLELQFNEPTETLTGEQWEELVISLNADDTVISPFITMEMTQEE